MTLVARRSRRQAEARLGRGAPARPLDVVAAEGSRVRDAEGREHIDLLMGHCVGNLGWNHPALVEALRRYDGPSYIDPGLRWGPWEELAEGLCAVAPGSMATAFRAVGGTEAVELALQLAKAATGRERFVCLEGAYHGNSFGALSVGDEAGEGPLDCRTLAPPFDEARLADAKRLLKKEKVAAVILEPVPIALGVLLPEPAFLQGLAALCRDHGTLLIADEVATGFGRTGTLFACERYGLEPDLVCLAKAITGGHAPLGATLATGEVARVAEEVDFYSTFGWHPLAVQAALANLAVWRREESALLANAAARSEQLSRRLERLLGDRAEVRAVGLAVAVDLDDEDEAERLAARGIEEGVLFAAQGGRLMLFPALTIDEPTLEEGLDRLERCL